MAESTEKLEKKLVLNKKTIAKLSDEEMSSIHAGFIACWENLWTLYYCKVVYTGDRPE